MHLFMSFIMRAIAVFIKDVILFESGEPEHCFVSSVSSRPRGRFHLTLLFPPYSVAPFKERTKNDLANASETVIWEGSFFFLCAKETKP